MCQTKNVTFRNQIKSACIIIFSFIVISSVIVVTNENKKQVGQLYKLDRRRMIKFYDIIFCIILVLFRKGKWVFVGNQ